MGMGVERVESFVYLGDCLDAAVVCRSAVTARVRADWNKFRELSGILCTKDWSLVVKAHLYRTCVRTVMTYENETWALKKQ